MTNLPTYLKVLRDLDYENLTMDELIKARKFANYAHTLMEHYCTNPYKGEKISLIEDYLNFSSLATAAYGILNPYSEHTDIIRSGIRLVEEIRETLTEGWLLENIEYKGKKQTFSPFVMFNRQYGSPSVTESQIDFQNFISTVIDYEDLKDSDEKMNIYREALRKETLENEYMIQTKNNLMYVIVNEETTKVTKYSFTNWMKVTGTDTVNSKKAKNGEYKEAIKQEFPEWYL